MNLYLETLLFTSDIVVPIFFIVFLGYLLRRYRVIDDGFVTTSSRLVFTITLPALVFMSISQTDFKAVFNPELLLLFTGFTLVTVALLWWLSGRMQLADNARGVFVQGRFAATLVSSGWRYASTCLPSRVWLRHLLCWHV
ncbi:AEC family transporter [Aliamphritea spongicola]|nr:AEC family transporter [Aliamphritea spongicola]